MNDHVPYGPVASVWWFTSREDGHSSPYSLRRKKGVGSLVNSNAVGHDVQSTRTGV